MLARILSQNLMCWYLMCCVRRRSARKREKKHARKPVRYKPSKFSVEKSSTPKHGFRTNLLNRVGLRYISTMSAVEQFGHYHLDTNRAAYWDDRNAIGEPVASNVYFYTLTAGDFTTTRKLLILK